SCVNEGLLMSSSRMSQCPCTMPKRVSPVPEMKPWVTLPSCVRNFWLSVALQEPAIRSCPRGIGLQRGTRRHSPCPFVFARLASSGYFQLAQLACLSDALVPPKTDRQRVLRRRCQCSS